jgi:MFS family permease
VLLVAEHSPDPKRGFWSSWPQAGVPVGNMLATVVLLALTATLTEASFLSWGWRIAFWLSAVVVLVGYYIRTKVSDAPIFVEAQQEAEQIKAACTASSRCCGVTREGFSPPWDFGSRRTSCTTWWSPSPSPI